MNLHNSHRPLLPHLIKCARYSPPWSKFKMNKMSHLIFELAFPVRPVGFHSFLTREAIPKTVL